MDISDDDYQDENMDFVPNDYVVEEEVEPGSIEITVGDTFHSTLTGVPTSDRFGDNAQKAYDDINSQKPGTNILCMDIFISTR